MSNLALGPIRAAITVIAVLALTGCGSNTTNREDSQLGEPDARAANSMVVDAEKCSWPASVTSSGDSDGLGCWAKPTFSICETPNGGWVNAQDGTVQVVMDDCKYACSTSEYALTCTGDTMVPSSVPSPDSSLGCTVIPIPTPSSVQFYCCPCK